jgi:hypothetical protein
MPSTEQQGVIDKSKGFLSREMAMDILDFIYNFMYGGNFQNMETEITYRDHVAEIRELVSADLKPLVPLKDLAPW